VEFSRLCVRRNVNLVTSEVRQFAGRHDRQPGHAAGSRRAEGDLPVGLAGRRRRQHRRARCIPTSRSIRPTPPELAKRINRTLQRADQIETSEGNGLSVDTWFAPIVADAEAGFGGPLNAFELMKAMIEAGAAGVHFEDQLASAKKCGHLGGKVLSRPGRPSASWSRPAWPPTSGHVPTLVIARTDAERRHAADLRHRRARPRVRHYRRTHRPRASTTSRTASIRHRPRPGLRAVRRPDLVRDLEAGSRAGAPLRRGDPRSHPGKLLAYNCSPSFNWKKNLDDATIAKFQRELGAMGYKFQFITLAGFHQLNHGMFELARGYKERQMSAYSELQEAEFAPRSTATRRPSTSARSAPATSTPCPRPQQWAKDEPRHGLPWRGFCMRRRGGGLSCLAPSVLLRPIAGQAKSARAGSPPGRDE
jgi:hypothetical protein